MHICICMYVCIYIYVYIYIYMYIYRAHGGGDNSHVCMYVCMYMYIYICIYIAPTVGVTIHKISNCLSIYRSISVDDTLLTLNPKP
jgi:hypothetical protein